MEVEIFSEEIVKIQDAQNKNFVVEELSVLDMIMPSMYVNRCYIYQGDKKDGSFHISNLIKSLQVVLQEFPQVAGRIEHTSTRCVLHHDNNGVKIIKSKANFSLIDAQNANYDLDKLPESEIFLPCVNRSPEGLSTQSFLLIVHMICLTDESIMLIVSYYHPLCDGPSITRFLNAWGHATRFGTVGQYTNTREPRVKINTVPIENVKDSEPVSINVLPQSYARTSRPIVFHRLNVNVNKLNNLKDTFSSSLSSDFFLSRNDIFTAMLWKATVKAKQNNNGAMSTFALVVNCRKQLGLFASYFGNCVLHSKVSLLESEVISTPLKELALIIRNSISQMTTEYIKEKITCLEKLQDRSKIKFDKLDLHGNDILCSTLVNIDMYDFDFGLDKPINILARKSGSVPKFAWIFPSINTKEWILNYSLYEDEMKQFLLDQDMKEILTL